MNGKNESVNLTLYGKKITADILGETVSIPGVDEEYNAKITY